MTTPAAVGRLPGAAELAGLLDGLLDRGTTAQQQDGPVLPGRDVAVVAAYAEPDGAVRAVAMLDLAAAACLGAALALAPGQRVGDALSAGALPTELADSTREVLDVLASLLAGDGAPLTLAALAVAPMPVGAPTVRFLRAQRRRKDLVVTVPGYGEGRVALVVG